MIMRTLSERLVHARTKAGLSQESLAKAAGVSQGTIGHLEKGVTRSSKHLVEIAMVLGVRPAWLATGVGESDANFIEPEVQAKRPVYRLKDTFTRNPQSMVDSVRSKFELAKHDVFALLVEGDAMKADGEISFPDGCIVGFDPSREVKVGDFVLAALMPDHRPIFRQLTFDGTTHFLKPLNSAYPVMEIHSLGCIFAVAFEYYIGGTL